jgi:hypothetical protein
MYPVRVCHVQLDYSLATLLPATAPPTQRGKRRAFGIDQPPKVHSFLVIRTKIKDASFPLASFAAAQGVRASKGEGLLGSAQGECRQKT